MCGGSLKIIPGSDVAVCEYCGTEQAVPWLKANPDAASVIVKTNLAHGQAALQKKEWDKAAHYFTIALDYDEQNSDAMLGLLLTEARVSSEEDLENGTYSISDSQWFRALEELGEPGSELVAKLSAAEEKVEENIRREKEKKKRRRKHMIVGAAVAAALIILAFAGHDLYVNVIQPARMQKYIESLAENGEYQKALDAADENQMEMPDDFVNRCKYGIADNAFKEKDYDHAISCFFKLSREGYSDSGKRLAECYFEQSMAEISAGEYKEALADLRRLSNTDAADPMIEIDGEEKDAGKEGFYRLTVAAEESGDLDTALDAAGYIKDDKDGELLYKEINYKIAEEKAEANNQSLAIKFFSEASGYKDADARILEQKYIYCQKRRESPDEESETYITALTAGGYPGAAALEQEMHRWHGTISFYRAIQVGNYQAEGIELALAGGPRSGSTKVRFEIYADGEHVSVTSEDTVKRGGTAVASVYNQDAGRDIFDIVFKVYCYDDGGNLICSAQGKAGE